MELAEEGALVGVAAGDLLGLEGAGDTVFAGESCREAVDREWEGVLGTEGLNERSEAEWPTSLGTSELVGVDSACPAASSSRFNASISALLPSLSRLRCSRAALAAAIRSEAEVSDEVVKERIRSLLVDELGEAGRSGGVAIATLSDPSQSWSHGEDGELRAREDRERSVARRD